MRLHNPDVSTIFRRVAMASAIGSSMIFASCAPDPGQQAMSQAVHDAGVRANAEWRSETSSGYELKNQIVHLLPIEMQAVKERKIAAVIVSDRTQIPMTARLADTAQTVDVGDGGWMWFDYGKHTKDGLSPALPLGPENQSYTTVDRDTVDSARQFARLAGAGAYVYDQRYDQYYRATYFVQPVIGLIEHQVIGVKDQATTKMLAAEVEFGAKDSNLVTYVPVGDKIVEGLDADHSDDQVQQYAHPVPVQNQDAALIGGVVAGAAAYSILNGQAQPQPSPTPGYGHGGGYITRGAPVGGAGGGVARAAAPTEYTTTARGPVYVPPVMRGSPVVEAEAGHVGSFGRAGGFSAGRGGGGFGHAGGFGGGG